MLTHPDHQRGRFLSSPDSLGNRPDVASYLFIWPLSTVGALCAPTTADGLPIPPGSIPGPGLDPLWSASGCPQLERAMPSRPLSEVGFHSCAPGNTEPSIFDGVLIASSLKDFWIKTFAPTCRRRLPRETELTVVTSRLEKLKIGLPSRLQSTRLHSWRPLKVSSYRRIIMWHSPPANHHTRLRVRRSVIDAIFQVEHATKCYVFEVFCNRENVDTCHNLL